MADKNNVQRTAFQSEKKANLSLIYCGKKTFCGVVRISKETILLFLSVLWVIL